MRQRNLPVVITGAVMIVLAGGFFFFMLMLMPRSNNPAAMMETVGQVSGAVGALGLAMIVFGLIGKRR